MSAGWKPLAGYLVSMAPARLRRADGSDRRMKVLYFCEGYTDIRFVVGLSEICDLTMAIPERRICTKAAWRAGSPKAARACTSMRSRAAGSRSNGDRSRICFAALRSFDVVLSQEMGRGSLNATALGKALRVPVVCYLGTSPVEYFHCRRVRGQVGRAARLGVGDVSRERDEGDRRTVVGGGDDRTVSQSRWRRVSRRACSRATTAASTRACSRR